MTKLSKAQREVLKRLTTPDGILIMYPCEWVRGAWEPTRFIFKGGDYVSKRTMQSLSERGLVRWPTRQVEITPAGRAALKDTP
jgi:ribosomal protein S19E (S16A)